MDKEKKHQIKVDLFILIAIICILGAIMIDMGQVAIKGVYELDDKIRALEQCCCGGIRPPRFSETCGDRTFCIHE